MGPLPKYKFLYSVSSEALSNLAYDFEHRYLDRRDPETYITGLRDAVDRWRQFSEDDPGYLGYRRGPGFVTVEDRRAGLEAADYTFDGIEGKIYLACDAGATADHLSTQFAVDCNEELDAKVIEEFLDQLVQAQLMYREGNSFLSLAIPITTAPPASEASKETDAATCSMVS
jgi:hypothetical protein